MDWELIWWIAVDCIALLGLLIAFAPINWECFKKDDPYKDCPKEEE